MSSTAVQQPQTTTEDGRESRAHRRDQGIPAQPPGSPYWKTNKNKKGKGPAHTVADPQLDTQEPVTSGSRDDQDDDEDEDDVDEDDAQRPDV